jgi:hypothetical protein
MLLKTDRSSLDQSSMVAENLQRIEKQDDASKLMLQTALKHTAATAVAGEQVVCAARCVLTHPLRRRI